MAREYRDCQLMLSVGRDDVEFVKADFVNANKLDTFLFSILDYLNIFLYKSLTNGHIT